MSQRTLSASGLSLLKTFESCRLQAYMCPANKVTIGYGHVLVPAWDHDLFKIGRDLLNRYVIECQCSKKITPDGHRVLRINPEQAEKLLAQDVKNTQLFINSVTSGAITLTQGQFDALVSFVFNVGHGAYAQSTLRKLVNAGDFTAAAEEFCKWVYTTQNGKKIILEGLVKRRAAERALFEGNA